MRRLKLSFYILCFASSPHAEAAEICQNVIGDDQSIEIPAGKRTRVMFFIRGPEAGYIELCKVTDGQAKLMYAAAADASGWYKAAELPPENGKYYAKNYAARISWPAPHSWTGMRREPTSFGYAFNWFESIDDPVPNVTVEFCVQDSIESCPSHVSAHRAKNLAPMSLYARDLWLKRWMEKRGHTKETSQ
jgi:hypothetical protein